MARLTLLHYPDTRLREQAEPVTKFDDDLRQLASDMAETMYAHRGIGLAAIQVGVTRRVVVLDTSEERNALLTLVNPEVVRSEGLTEHEEGCLSVPDVYEPVVRPERVWVRAHNLAGETIELDVEGLRAICIQHEIDHLDGKLFIDRLSRLKQDRLRKRVAKRGRQERLAVA
ncbi:MAG: peptide deformylase [Pseudomonadota bacterium]|nr:peptide deformylase [Pseudomonadota bacterium]